MRVFDWGDEWMVAFGYCWRLQNSLVIGANGWWAEAVGSRWWIIAGFE